MPPKLPTAQPAVKTAKKPVGKAAKTPSSSPASSANSTPRPSSGLQAPPGGAKSLAGKGVPTLPGNKGVPPAGGKGPAKGPTAAQIPAAKSADGKAPAKGPMPSGAKSTPDSAGSPKGPPTTGAKGPGKAPTGKPSGKAPIAADNNAAAPPATAAGPTKVKVPPLSKDKMKLPLKKPGSAPSSGRPSAQPSVAPSATASNAGDLAALDEMLAAVDESPAVTHRSNEADALLAPNTGRSESSVPPPPPPDSATTSALVSPRERLDDVLGPPGPPGEIIGTPTQPPLPEVSPEQARADMMQALMRGEWPAQQGGDFSLGKSAISQQTVDDYEAKIRQLERKLIESERHADEAQHECGRMREALYEREGVKVVQHLSELERENRKLRHQLQKEKEAVLYHQSAHMSTMDELIQLKQNVDTVGDYNHLKVQYDRLQEKLSTTIRANTELSLKLSEVNELYALTTVTNDSFRSPGKSPVSPLYERGLLPGQDNMDRLLPTFVKVRRAALCETCQGMVDRWEHAMTKRLASSHALPAMPPSASFADPTTNMNFLSSHPVTGAPGTQFAGGWRTLTLGDGKVVYHNPITNQSQWTPPDEVRRYTNAAAGVNISPRR